MGSWYMPRKEIEENSPSRKDGIGLKKETSLRKSYCTFLKDLGIRLQLPKGTIATAIIFCHRFFLRQSHAKNDQRTIATVCMFLAAKVKETPCHLKDVILISYKMIHKKDPAALLMIQQKEVYEQQKELVLLGERVLLTTLDFDLNVQHPFVSLAEAIIKFNVEKNYALVQVAWHFVNDGLSTSLCLQFKPTHIAASALFLAAKFLKMNLPLDGEKIWLQEYDVTSCQLEEISYQMLELYEQKEIPTSQGREAFGALGWGTRAAIQPPATNEEQASEQISYHPDPQHSSSENNAVPLKTEMGSVITDHWMDLETRESQSSEKLPRKDNEREVANRPKSWTDRIVAGDQDRMVGQTLELQEGPVGHSPKEAFQMIDQAKLKAALEKRRKEQGEMAIKKYVTHEVDLIEREIERGVELAAANEKNKREKRQNWFKPEDVDDGKVHEETGDGRQRSMKEQFLKCVNEYNAEDREVIDDASLLFSNRKRKMWSPPAGPLETKKQLGSSYHNQR